MDDHESAVGLPTLRFTPYAWAKLLFLRDQGDTEIGAFGVAAPDDLTLIQDLYVPHQDASSVFVSFRDEAIADMMDNLLDQGRQPREFMRVWIHTHPGDSPAPSSVDEETFRRVFGNCDWAIMYILARGGNSYARLRVNSGGIRLHRELNAAIEFAGSWPASNEALWKKEYDDNVVETRTSYVWGKGTYSNPSTGAKAGDFPEPRHYQDTGPGAGLLPSHYRRDLGSQTAMEDLDKEFATIYADEVIRVRDRMKSISQQEAEDAGLSPESMQWMPPDSILIEIEDECLREASQSPALAAYLEALGNEHFNRAKKLVRRNQTLRTALQRLSMATRRHLSDVVQERLPLFGGDFASYQYALEDDQSLVNNSADASLETLITDAELDEILREEWDEAPTQESVKPERGSLSAAERAEAMKDLALAEAEAGGLSNDATDRIVARVETALRDDERAARPDFGAPTMAAPVNRATWRP